MGFSSSNPYTAGLIGAVQDQVLPALEFAAERVRAGTADAACTRWFGDNSAAFKSALVPYLRRLRSSLNIRTIKVGFERLGARDAATNAGAWPSAGTSLDIGAPLTHVPFGREEIELDEAFTALPDYLVRTAGAGLIDATFYNQSKFETLVHELSHLLLGTADVQFGGGPAYGAQSASLLAAANSADAVDNAENWGIFVEAVGVHNTS